MARLTLQRGILFLNNLDFAAVFANEQALSFVGEFGKNIFFVISFLVEINHHVICLLHHEVVVSHFDRRLALLANAMARKLSECVFVLVNLLKLLVEVVAVGDEGRVVVNVAQKINLVLDLFEVLLYLVAASLVLVHQHLLLGERALVRELHLLAVLHELLVLILLHFLHLNHVRLNLVHSRMGKWMPHLVA